jgi:diaminopimelate decarboxylase
MASNYNMLPKPAVVFVDKGKDILVVERETYDDLLAKQKFIFNV